MGLFYISFATDEGFRGATVVDAVSTEDALVQATMRGLNPGGEAAILPVPEGLEDEPDCRALLNRLASKEEMLAQGGERLGDLPDEIQEAFEQDISTACENCND